MFTLNVTGPETAGVQETAKKLAALLGREPIFTGEASDTAYLNNAGKNVPAVRLSHGAAGNADRMAGTVDFGRRARIGQATHFEERKGSY